MSSALTRPSEAGGAADASAASSMDVGPCWRCYVVQNFVVSQRGIAVLKKADDIQQLAAYKTLVPTLCSDPAEKKVKRAKKARQCNNAVLLGILAGGGGAEINVQQSWLARHRRVFVAAEATSRRKASLC